jgi:hypothetical protein
MKAGSNNCVPKSEGFERWLFGWSLALPVLILCSDSKRYCLLNPAISKSYRFVGDGEGSVKSILA